MDDAIPLLLTVLLFVSVMSVLMMASSLLVGWLVFRSKREQHETLMLHRVKSQKKPVNIDEFGDVDDEDPAKELNDLMDEQMQSRVGRFASIFKTDQVREKAGAEHE